LANERPISKSFSRFFIRKKSASDETPSGKDFNRLIIQQLAPLSAKLAIWDRYATFHRILQKQK
jgi:hypothetical protein